jgi:hypothetical protein
MSSLKREVRERDDTIADKERRLYDLKRKNQASDKGARLCRRERAAPADLRRAAALGFRSNL